MAIFLIIISFINILLSCINDMIAMSDVPSVISPSEKYEYHIQEEGTYVLVGIYDMDGNLLFLDDEKYYKRFALIVEWQEDDDTLWLYSGGIGVFYFVFENNEWRKISDKSEKIADNTPRRIAKKLSSYRD